jgi:hypothetical protein
MGRYAKSEGRQVAVEFLRLSFVAESWWVRLFWIFALLWA